MRRSIDDEIGDDSLSSSATGRFELMDALELLGRRLGGAIMVAGGLIAFGIYAGGDEAQTYHAFAADGEVFRVNTDSGTIIACNANRCTQILERGQDLAEDQEGTLFKAAPGAPVAQLPGPAPQQPRPAEGIPTAAQPSGEPAAQPR